MMNAYHRWLQETWEDVAIQNELLAIAEDRSAIEDRFYSELEFGTGGLRGVLGAGTNRMNLYTIGKATQGYCNYLNKNVSSPSVSIAYDSRINSDLFAKRSATIFAANGIRVYIYDHLMPTPSLSFAIRDLHCSGGVVITASHNPSNYNGYKVYGPDGCQITNEIATAIQKEINTIDPFADVPSGDFEKMLEDGQISFIGTDTISRYLAAASSVSILPDGIDKKLAIVYTPLNGSGISCVPQCLKEHGFVSIIIPPEQKDPDGNFPTCPYPNPEIREALEVGLRWADKTCSDLLLATDPDCDRVGTAVKVVDGYILISGNEMGALLLDFICRMRLQNGTLPHCPVAVKTIVTTPMAEKIAAHYGIRLINVLTGFKYIGEQIGYLEKKGEVDRYVFGFEESYGYLAGSFVRDKDAVSSSLLICEMFAWYKAKGMTLVDALNGLYAQYGFYQSKLLSYTFEGASGHEKIHSLISSLRKTVPKQLAGEEVIQIVDYSKNGTGLPPSNVLRYILSSGEVVVRPSGTEPKLKIYLTAAKESAESSKQLIEKLTNHFAVWVQ